MAWDISAAWNTGDINSRVTNTCAVIDDAGTPKIISPVQHGVRCYSADGNTTHWTYTGINNGYDVRDIAVGNLNATGYNDCVAIASGYYATASHGMVGIVDKDGNELQELLTSDFTGSPARCEGIVINGTDIYVSTSYGLHKFTKSGSTWSESWAKEIGNCSMVSINDMGNGTRIYVNCLASGDQGVKCYQPDGTLDWSYVTGNAYSRIHAIGKSDSTKTGLQMAIPFQNGFAIIDKDGNLSQNFTSSGTNVRVSAIFYDCDGDGEDEIYYTDMGRDVWCIERTGTNTYSLKYSLLDAINASQYAGLANFDINDDGDDEIFIFTTDGHCLIYDKTLNTQLKDLNIGHGTVGGYYSIYQIYPNGFVFEDLDGDGHEDLAVSGATGYVDVFLCSGFEAGASTETFTFTADGLIKVINTKTFTSDGVVKVEGLTETFTSDGVVKVIGTEESTSDGVVKVIQTQTFTSDGIIRAIYSKTLTSDGIIVLSGTLRTDLWQVSGVTERTKTFTIDGIVKVETTNTFTIDAVVKVIETEEFTADGIVLVQITNTFTIDGIVLAQQTSTFTADGIVLVQSSATITADGVVKVVESNTFTADGIVLEVQSETFTADGIVKETFAETHTADAIIAERKDETYTGDAIIKEIQTETITADGIVKETLIHSHTADAVIKAAGEETHTADGIVKETFDHTHTADASIRGRESESYTVDAIVKEIKVQTITSDGIIKQIVASTITADGIVLETLIKDYTADAIIKEATTSTYTVDGIIKEVLASSHTADAIIAATQESTHTADGVVKETQEYTHTADGIVRAFSVHTQTADAIIFERVKTHTADGIIAQLITFNPKLIFVDGEPAWQITGPHYINL